MLSVQVDTHCGWERYWADMADRRIIHLLRKMLRVLVVLVPALMGIAFVVRTTNENESLREQVLQLEAELGRMSIDDPSRIYLVAIEQPQVPPEVLREVDHLWQFRCYLPPNYSFKRMTGSGRVGEGVFCEGSSSSSWSTPRAEPYHELLSISLKHLEKRVECYISFGGSSGTTSWNRVASAFEEGNLESESLVEIGDPARSFDQETILPLIKIFDPNTEQEKSVDEETIKTYSGGLVVICPTSREAEFNELKSGRIPMGFEPAWIAKGKRDELSD